MAINADSKAFLKKKTVETGHRGSDFDQYSFGGA